MGHNYINNNEHPCNVIIQYIIKYVISTAVVSIKHCLRGGNVVKTT